MLWVGQNRLSKLLQATYRVKTAYYTLCGVQNGLSEPLHASYTLCSVQNRLSESLQASYMLYGGQNRLSECLQASYTICWSQNSLLIALWEAKQPPTHFAGVKMTYVPCWGQNELSKSLHASYIHTSLK